MNVYPKLYDYSQKSITESLTYIIKERRQDVNDFNNLKNIFVSGRKVAKIPSSSADVDASDRVGDINYDASYLYILVDNGGSPSWRRSTLSSW